MKHKAPRNRTVTLKKREISAYQKRLLSLSSPVDKTQVLNKTICQDILEAASFLPAGFVDLAFIDPPY
ncbi:MAG: site-specific DNA-methyltransferase, partial [Candidatus Dadabacteria bacterium]